MACLFFRSKKEVEKRGEEEMGFSPYLKLTLFSCSLFLSLSEHQVTPSAKGLHLFSLG